MKVFVARQPIFKLNNKVDGYEFLYRDSEQNRYNNDVDGSAATRSLISTLVVEFGLEKMTSGNLAYLNMTEEVLLSQYPMHLNYHYVIFEILESVVATPVLLERVRQLQEKGYRFALDDYIGEPNAFIKYADVIKVDFRLTTVETQREIAEKYGEEKVLLAEKIETEEEFLLAKEMGYTLFQGYYFSKPVLSVKNAAQVTSPVYWRVWNEANKPNVSFDRLVKLIQLDAGLSYQFLASQNAAAVYRGNAVKTLKLALINMGIKHMRRRLLLVLVKSIMQNEKLEVAKQALARAVFCSSIVVEAGYAQFEEDAYVIGLFSMLESIMEEDLEGLLDGLQIGDSAKKALLFNEGFLGEVLFFTCIYERAEWDLVQEFIERHGIEGSRVGELYMESITYADKIFGLAEQDRQQANTG